MRTSSSAVGKASVNARADALTHASLGQPHPFAKPTVAALDTPATASDQSTNLLHTALFAPDAGGLAAPVQMHPSVTQQEHPLSPIQNQAVAESPENAAAVTLPANEGGTTLPNPIRQKFEAAFQADLGDVRVHESAEASSIGALAYTQGTHIHFAPGQYDLATQGGQELLGHELTHVLQQRAGRVATPKGEGVPINADPTLETEADVLGDRAAQGEVVEHPASANGGIQAKAAPVIQRTPQEEAVGTMGNLAGATSLGGSIVEGAQASALGTLGLNGLGQMPAIAGIPSGLLSGLGSITSAVGLGTGLAGLLNPESSMPDKISSGLSAFSGATGLLGSAADFLGYEGLFAAGGSAGLSAEAGLGGAAWASGTATALGSAGAVAGAGAAGYGIGQLLDAGAGAMMDVTGYSDLVDSMAGVHTEEADRGFSPDRELIGAPEDDAAERAAIYRDMYAATGGVHSESDLLSSIATATDQNLAHLLGGRTTSPFQTSLPTRTFGYQLGLLADQFGIH